MDFVMLIISVVLGIIAYEFYKNTNKKEGDK